MNSESSRDRAAREMETLCRMVKAQPGVEISALARDSGLSEGRVRYYIEFFVWYGIASSADLRQNPQHAIQRSERSVERAFVHEANRTKVEARSPNLQHFFRDAYVELPCWLGED